MGRNPPNTASRKKRQASRSKGLCLVASVPSDALPARPPMNAAAHLIGDDLSNTPGWHSDKWSGIALAPNGKLYCSPFTASKVLRINPATDTTELIGDVLEPSGNIRWSGIALASDGKLYCSPNNASRVLRIDPATDATELIGDDLSAHGEGSPPGHMWSGIAAAADGKLYCSPKAASRVLRIDPATGATELIGDDLSPQCGPHGGFGGIVATADGKLYCWPKRSGRVPKHGRVPMRVLRIDPATCATELIGDDLTDWMGTWAGGIVPPDGIVAAADGKLYCYHGPCRSYLRPTPEFWVRMDPATGVTELVTLEDVIGDGVIEKWTLAVSMQPISGRRTEKRVVPVCEVHPHPYGGCWDLIVAAADGKLYRLYYTSDVEAIRAGRCGGYQAGGVAAAADGTLYSPPLGDSQVLRIRLSAESGEGDGAARGAAAKKRKAEAAAGEAEAEADAAASSKKKRKCKA